MTLPKLDNQGLIAALCRCHSGVVGILSDATRMVALCSFSRSLLVATAVMLPYFSHTECPI